METIKYSKNYMTIVDLVLVDRKYHYTGNLIENHIIIITPKQTEMYVEKTECATPTVTAMTNSR